MPVPKRKTARTKRNMRRSHHALTPPNLVESLEGEVPEMKRPHRVSRSGWYKGRQVAPAKKEY